MIDFTADNKKIQDYKIFKYTILNLSFICGI